MIKKNHLSILGSSIRSFFVVFFIITAIAALLSGCNTQAPSAFIGKHYDRETWMQYVDSTPNQWLHGTSNWFLQGIGHSSNQIPTSNFAPAILTKRIPAPIITKIKVQGDFHIQLVGSNKRQPILVYGPKEAVREIKFTMQGKTLFIHQTGRAPLAGMRQVIIRIYIQDLQSLVQLGRGAIEGIGLHSQHLAIFSNGNGSIYLAGDLKIWQVTNISGGSITILGANTNQLTIKTSGTGHINIAGHVGIKQILHYGTNNINILGADSNNLTVCAEGQGKIGIRGRVNVYEIKSKDDTCVFIIGVVGTNTLYVDATGNTAIGLAGTQRTFDVEAKDHADVEARYLCTKSAFVKAYETAHVNVVASERIFASTAQNASIYYYAYPHTMSSFVGPNTVIMPIWHESMHICPAMTVYH